MKKTEKRISMMLAAALLLCALTPAFAATPVTPTLEGVVTQVREDGSFLIETAEPGIIQVNVGEETVFEGLGQPIVGAYVNVVYSGAMTRSIPPQVFAQRVSWHLLNGFVIEGETPEGAFLMDAMGYGQVLVRLAQGMAVPAAGDFVSVAFSGVMTMSLPGQGGAQRVEVLEKAEGEVAGMGETSFTVTLADGTARKVNMDATIQSGTLESGKKVSVFFRPAEEGAVQEEITAIAIIAGE